MAGGLWGYDEVGHHRERSFSSTSDDPWLPQRLMAAIFMAYGLVLLWWVIFLTGHFKSVLKISNQIPWIILIGSIHRPTRTFHPYLHRRVRKCLARILVCSGARVVLSSAWRSLPGGWSKNMKNMESPSAVLQRSRRNETDLILTILPIGLFLLHLQRWLHVVLFYLNYVVSTLGNGGKWKWRKQLVSRRSWVIC